MSMLVLVPVLLVCVFLCGREFGRRYSRDLEVDDGDDNEEQFWMRHWSGDDE